MLAIKGIRARRNGEAPLWLPGNLTPLVGAALLASALLATLGDVASRVSIAVDMAAFFVGSSGIFMLMYLVFFTRGRGHYQLTVWRVTDIFVGNILGQVALNVAAWKFLAPLAAFSHTTPDVAPLYALYDLALYTVLFFSGGGLVDNLPVSELTRLAVSLQQMWSSYSYVIIFAAADATLAVHTDEQAPTAAPAAQRTAGRL